MKELNKRETVLTSITIFALLLGYIQFYQLKKNREIKEAKIKINQKKNLIRNNQLIISSLSSRSIASNNAESQVKLDGKDQKLSSIISTLSRDSGPNNYFEVKKIHLEDTSAESGITEIKYIVDVTTTFFNLGRFLEELEKNKTIMKVNAIEVFNISRQLRNCSARINVSGYQW